MSGSPIHLRPLRPGDEEAAVRWAADDEFCRAIDWELNVPAERVRAHWQRIIGHDDPTFLRLGVEYQGDLIGYVDLSGISLTEAEFGIAIGERDLWGCGLGVQAGKMLIESAFEMLNLERITSQVHAPNRRSHRLMHKLGFTEVGVVGHEAYQGEVVPLTGYEVKRGSYPLPAENLYEPLAEDITGGE